MEEKENYSPDNPFETARPNPVQQEFIRLAAEKYWYLALGDTDHAKASIEAFALCSSMLTPLEQAGKTHYFRETPTGFQKYYDWASNPRPSGLCDVNIRRARRHFGSMWKNQRENDRVRRIFESAARAHPGIRFVAADKRNVGPLRFFGTLALTVINAGVKSGLSAISRLSVPDKMGRVCKKASRALPHSHLILSYFLGRDRKTVQCIKGFEKPAVILFGANHFTKKYDSQKKPRHMGSLLPEKGKNLCVLNIYADFYQYSHYTNVDCEDGELLVHPTARHPEGIIIKNPALQPLFEQAVKTVRARNIMMTRTQETAPVMR